MMNSFHTQGHGRTTSYLNLPQEVKEMIYYNLYPKTMAKIILTNSRIKDSLPIYIQDELSYGSILIKEMNKINPIISYNIENGRLEFNEIGKTIFWEEGPPEYIESTEEFLNTVIYPRNQITLYSTTDNIINEDDGPYDNSTTNHIINEKCYTFDSPNGFKVKDIIEIVSTIENMIYSDLIDLRIQYNLINGIVNYDIDNILYFPRFIGLSWSQTYGIYNIEWGDKYY